MILVEQFSSIFTEELKSVRTLFLNSMGTVELCVKYILVTFRETYKVYIP